MAKQKTKSISQKTAEFRADYQKREINLLLAYERCMRVLDLQLETVENQLTAGMAYHEGILSKDLIKFSCDLSKTIKEITKLHIQVQDVASKGNKKPLSLEEKKEHAVAFIAGLPPGHREECIQMLSDQLLFRWSRKMPNGHPPENFVHPLDRS